MRDRNMKKLIKSMMLLSITAAMFYTYGLSSACGAEINDVKGKRYQVFMTPPLTDTSSAIMTFRSDNILVIDTIDGYGIYMPVLNFFAAYYWAPDFYLGRPISILLTGFAMDPFITAVGVGYIGNNIHMVLITGYSLSSNNL
jgi:hypothetical protein